MRLLMIIALISCSLMIGLSDQITPPASSSSASDNEIVTVVGRGLGDDGPAGIASLIPGMMVFDRENNLFIVDREHRSIRRVDAASGIITTVAGSGEFCVENCLPIDNIPAIDAALNNISDFVLDSAGNIFLAENGIDIHRVRRIDAQTGIITTIAGDGTSTDLGDGGLARDTQLTPISLAFNNSGQLFISDARSHRIRCIDQNGIITTVAGNGKFEFCGLDGPALDVALYPPDDMVFDQAGNLFFAVACDHVVRKLDLESGLITTIVGDCDAGFQGDGGPAIKAQLDTPTGLALDRAGNLLIVDTRNMRIRRVDARTGIIDRIVGDGYIYILSNEGSQFYFGRFAGDNGPAIDASLNYPAGIAFDSDNNLFIADAGNFCVRRVEADNQIITTVVGRGRDRSHKPFATEPDGIPALDAKFGLAALAIDPAGNILAAQTDAHKIRLITASDGILRTFAGHGAITTSNGTGKFSGDGKPATRANFNYPVGIVIDQSGNTYIADTHNERIRRVKAGSGIIRTIAGNGKEGFSGDGGPAINASLSGPSTIALDQNQNLIIVDSGNQAIRRLDAQTGIITTIAGTGQLGFSGDGGPAKFAQFYDPEDIAINSKNDIFILDLGNRRVRKIDAASGIITTIAGGGDSATGLGDGLLATAVAFIPGGIAIDRANNIYISDETNARIRRVDAITGIITTVAGNGRPGYSGDHGPALKASLSPYRLNFDAQGNLYVISPPGIRMIKNIGNKN